MPGGSTLARISRSLSQSAVTAPSTALTACSSGGSTCASTKSTPRTVSGQASPASSRTVPTTQPVAMASKPGSAPCSTRTAHQATVLPGDAFQSTPKNCHSARPRRAARENRDVVGTDDIL
jgi:hypothetical protein